MTLVVFAGPSIFGIEQTQFPALTFKPPARVGDILLAARQGPQAIGLIDGLYENTAAVWHKEILHALSQGVRVYGASSMGALRAAECEPFGMVGIGGIFGEYSSGKRTSDADVALSHAPGSMGFRPLTIALIDVEATIDRLADLRSASVCNDLLAAARSIHFSHRTWKTVIRKAGLPEPLASELLGELKELRANRKAEDATLLLKTMSKGDPPPASQLSWQFQDTVFFRQLVHRTF